MDSSTKILHVSDNGLPDWRIEKSALSAKKRDQNNKVYFAGLFPNNVNINSTFDWTYFLDWDYKARYYYPDQWSLVKKQLLNIILDCKPDIIHAHDIFAMQLVKELNKSLGIPWIYDNHEYWSRSTVYKYLQNDHFNKTDPVHKHIPKLWMQWELDLIAEAEVPMLVCSNKIAEELNYFGNNNMTFALPNYPNLQEIKDIPEPQEHKEITSLYINSRKPYPGKMTPLTNNDGFFELFKDGELGLLHTIGWTEPKEWDCIHHNGYLPRDKMYQKMSESDLGIIPWKHHPFHPYCHPNRVNEMAHAGLLLLIPASLTSVSEDMNDMVVECKNHDDIKESIKLYRANPDLCLEYRVKSYKHAREHLLWENYEGNIFDAYNKAL